MTPGPAYLIASERSGTNLLRKRLTDCQDAYYGPAPAQFLKNLYYREPLYGDLAADANFRALIADALALCYTHFAPWDIAWSVDDVVALHGDRPRNSVQLADVVMRAFAESKGFATYLCKDNVLYEFALDIATQIPDAKFIYLHRDPRDFVLSQVNRPNTSGNPIEHARLWDYEQVKSIRVARDLALQGRCLALSYEQLVADEDRELARICDFLGVVKHAAQRRAGDNVVQQVHDWKNLDKDTMRDNVGKFEAAMKPADIARVEVVCAATMAHLGYPRVTTRTKPIAPVESALRHAWHGLRKVLRRNAGTQPPAVRERAKLLRRLHVNYRNPS